MQQAIKLKIDYSKIKDFDDIPFMEIQIEKYLDFPKDLEAMKKDTSSI